MRFPLARFTGFASALNIQTKEEGVRPLMPLIGTQRYFLGQVSQGLAAGIHDFLILKGRQLGYSTVSLALILWWQLNYRAMQGLIVNDSEENHNYFRDVLREMIATLPPDYRVPVLVDNDKILRWGIVENDKGALVGGSRTGYQIAASGRRKKGKLGRGQGINLLLGDEFDYWEHDEDMESLADSLAEHHRHRLFLRGSTANGYGVLYDEWEHAEPLRTKKIFIGSWLNEKYRLDKGTPLFAEYGDRPLLVDERASMDEVRRRYKVEIPLEHVAWRRYKLAVTFKNDEARLLSEHPWLPEEAFQSAGSKFIRPATIQRLRRKLADTPPPHGYVYQWGQRLDDCADPVPCSLSDAALTVWEEPDPGGAYLIGVVPMGSHDADSTEHALTVWRIYPDWIVQVAEYVSSDDATYQLTWALLHLCGAYHQLVPPFLALELQGTGRRVYEELDRFMNTGFGLSETVRASRNGVSEFLGNVRHYLYRRADSLTRTAARQWQGTNTLGTVLMHELRDQVERGYLEIRSPALVTALATLRQGGDGDGDSITGGGRSSDCLAVSAAIAIRHYVETAFPEIESLITPREGPVTIIPVERQLFRNYLSEMMTPRTDE